MIKIPKFDEPADFDAKVRQKGKAFLNMTPKPTQKEWAAHAYWQTILPEMGKMYNHICNYCATWVPRSTGSPSIDHFLNKSQNPNLAYEWNNYRYVSTRFNNRKGTRTIIDPVNLPDEMFILNMTNFFIEVNPKHNEKILVKLANDTIKKLKFNDDTELVNERAEYFFDYRSGKIPFDYLKKRAPFLAHEIARQGL